MKRTTTENQSLLCLLPLDLKAIIFEYLPLSDYSNLSLTCQDFNFTLSKRPGLWARHIFKVFLDITQKDTLFMDEIFMKISPKSENLKRNYHEMTDSKTILTDNFSLRSRFKAFLANFLSSEDCERLVNDLFEEVRNPSYPAPTLKKDVHHFSTRTLFQNFLTEVYFEIEGGSFFPIKKQKMIDDMIRQMRNKMSSIEFDYDSLVSIRWYLFDESKTQQKTDFSAKIQALSLTKEDKKTKKICENPLLIRRDGQDSKQPTLGLGKLLCLKPSNAKLSNKTEELMLLSEDEESLIDSQNSTPVAQGRSEDNPIKDFYWILYSITENHCQMVFTYLKSLHDPYLLVSEYTRLWSKFVLIVISFNQTFVPFVSAFNKFYNDECSNLPTFPEFSTWRLMVKLWIDKVFLNLKSHLTESFRYILMTLRSIEEACSNQSLIAQRCSSCFDNNLSYSGCEYLYKDLHYKPSRLDYNARFNRDTSIKLLRGFSDAMDDISYNEYTIFYWDCSGVNKETPKGVLEALIFEDSKLLYGYRKECLERNLADYRQFLKKDVDVIENLMGKPFSLELKRHQVFLLKELLPDTLREKIHNQGSSKSSSNENPTGKIIKTSSIESPSKRCLAYILEEQEDIECQSRDLQETKGHRHLRGFLVPDQRYTSFVELLKNPSKYEIEALGVEGRNVKEELESMEDQIIFL